MTLASIVNGRRFLAAVDTSPRASMCSVKSFRWRSGKATVKKNLPPGTKARRYCGMISDKAAIFGRIGVNDLDKSWPAGQSAGNGIGTVGLSPFRFFRRQASLHPPARLPLRGFPTPESAVINHFRFSHPPVSPPTWYLPASFAVSDPSLLAVTPPGSRGPALSVPEKD